MKSRIAFIALVMTTAFLTSAYTPAGLPPYPVGTGPGANFADPESVVRGYLEAVDRGELLSFERRLERGDINPVRVQYNYMIASGALETRVYSALKKPLPVPRQPEYQVIGVCSAIDNGRIVETESHVLIK